MSLPPATANATKAALPERALAPLAKRAWARARTGWLAFVLLALVLWGAWCWQQVPDSRADVQWISHERQFWADDEQGIRPLGAATAVTLPDSWKGQGLPASGVARYTTRFVMADTNLSDVQSPLWALRFDHISHVHRIWLNGYQLRNTVSRPQWRAGTSGLLVELPRGLLVAGNNQLVTEVHCVQQGGMSMPVLNLRDTLHPAYLWHQVMVQDLLIGLNTASTTFAFFMIILWAMRRQEHTAGLFGVMLLVASLRNTAYFVTQDFGINTTVSAWLYFMAHVITACTQGWFVMAILGLRVRWFNRLLWVVLLGFGGIGLLAAPWDPELERTRNVLQGMLLPLMLPGPWWVFKHSHRIDRAASIGLVLGWGGVLIAAVHDFVWIRLLGEVAHRLWLPAAVPMAMPAFAVIVMSRVVSAFNQIEEVNANLESKVADRTRELAAANAAKSHFLASASHDLRQPVAAIGLITDLLRGQLQDPALRGLTDRLTRAVVSMERLLKGLLDLSRLDSGTVDIQRQRVRLQPLLEAITNHEAETARHKGLSLRVRPTQAVAWTDPVLLEQILRNLIGNAVRHTRQGGILVGVRQQGPSLHIQVWDTGPGIAPADRDRIFDEFVQVGNPARDRTQGLGLGLAIVRRATQILGHRMTLRSQLGRGSCFGLSLPRPAARQAAPITPTPIAAAPMPSLEGLRVLVVEDEPAIRHALVSVLQSWGMTVTAGADLAWVTAQPAQTWDLLVSDHRLPDGTGRDVVQHLRQHQAELPALIITGDTLPSHLAQLADSGLSVLHKPFRAETLRAMIDSTMAPQRT
jgi:signal transduction histidine kinase